MKKLSKNRKRFLLNKNRKLIRHRRKRRNKSYNTSPEWQKQRLLIQPVFKDVIAPVQLVLDIKNSFEVLSFISKIKKNGDKGYFINLLLHNVQNISVGAISMLLSVISDLERKGIFFSGERPINQKANGILERSGFFEHMQGTVSKKNTISKNKILKTGDKNTHQKVLAPEIHKAMETVWGEKARCPALYGGLGEMVRNSVDHAFVDNGQIIWHLGISHFEDNKTCKFSFVDNGVGIINSFQKKGINKIIDYFKDQADFLKTAYENGIKSRTGLSWRGKGLPTIYEMYSEGIITRLVIITNNVYLDFDNKVFKKMATPFDGTYYFWEINSKCEPSYFKLTK